MLYDGIMGKRLTIALAVLALATVPIGAYVGGYFYLGDFASGIRPSGQLLVVREYPYKWLGQLFMPAAKIEAWVGGTEIDRVILRVSGKHDPEGLVFIARPK